MYFSLSTNTCSSKMEDKYLCVRRAFWLRYADVRSWHCCLPAVCFQSVWLHRHLWVRLRGTLDQLWAQVFLFNQSCIIVIIKALSVPLECPIIVWICHKICFGGVKVLSAQLMEISHQSQRFQIKVQLWSSSFPPFNPYAMRTNFWCFSLQGWLVWNIGTSSPEASEGVQSHQVMPPLFFFVMSYSIFSGNNWKCWC